MREFQLLRYLKKWLPWIVVLCVGLTAAVFVGLRASQEYVASAVIHYNDESAGEGLTPLGTELDVNEIKSSSILSRVLYNLELDSTYSVDDLISRISITEVMDEDEQALKDAMLEDGEEYTGKPTTYIVSFTADNSEGEEFARQVLDEVLDLYFSDYSENYVNVATTQNSLSRIYQDNYDYIEMMELIDSDLTSTISTLSQRANWGDQFRSTQTGLSFTDLAQEFSFIQSVRVSDLFSRIFEYQITRDKQLLLATYSTRIQNNGVEDLAEEEMRRDVVRLIDAYVEKMRDSGNTNITYEYILDDVYEKDLVDIYGDVVGQGDQTVTYDKLIFSWRDHSERREYALIDSAYCRYIMDVFSSCTGGCGAPAQSGAGEEAAAQTPCAQSPLTCTALSDPDYAALEREVEEDITALVGELEELYVLVNETNAEYNEYRGAQSISMLSTSSVEESVNVGLYTAIAAFFLLIVCCCGAILLGRLGDIVQYIFYTDHMTGMNNRTAFDTYLRRRDSSIVDDGTVCAAVAITNQAEINRQFGRSAGDDTIRLFADTLKEVFRKTQAYLVYNGNAQFFVVLERTDYVTVEYILHRFRLLLDKRETLRDECIEYEIGIAETYRDEVHRVRGLLSKAMDARTVYTAQPTGETGEAGGAARV